MTRTEATQFLRAQLDAQNLRDWKIRLVTDLTRPFLGMCSYKDKCIILNAHHVDTHGELEVINTIKHEIAHALIGPFEGHGKLWEAKAKELGCDSIAPCATYSFDARAIDAIRSGATLEVSYEERLVREPKYKISKLLDKCEVCGKVAKEKSRVEVKTSKGRKVVITLECLHIQIKDADSSSAFDEIVFDGDIKCKHDWNKTICSKCSAKRLYQYQIDGARALERANGRLALFDEMGLGKTIQELAYLKFHESDAWPFLWITKSGIKFQHAKEIIRLLGKRAFPQVVMNSKVTLIPGMNVVASYDVFRRLDLVPFQKHGFKSIILDECQAIKNPDSSRTQCIRTIARDIPKIVPLSGTPWKNRGSEFFVVLNMLDPIKFHSYKAFVDRWVNKYWQGNKEKEGGIREPERFREEIAHIAIRRERAEVMPELPLISRNKLLCEVPEHARKVYNEEQTKLIQNYNDAVLEGREDGFEAHQKLMQSLIIMRQILGIAKVPTTIEFAKEFLEDTDRKLVIFVHHKKCGELISEQLKLHCAEESLPQPLVLTADLNSLERSSVANKFNSNGTRVLIASTLASGEGLNLQSCSDCIMHERQWNPANEEQAEGRFIRIGQTAQAVIATYVHADNSIDTDLDKLVESKRRQFHETMNKGEMATWNEQGLISELIAGIAARK